MMSLLFSAEQLVTTLLVITKLHLVTAGSKCSDPHPSTGLSSWHSVEEREEGSYEQGWGVKSMVGKTTETAGPSKMEITDYGLIVGEPTSC